jgi:hypothetical protein
LKATLLWFNIDDRPSGTIAGHPLTPRADNYCRATYGAEFFDYKPLDIRFAFSPDHLMWEVLDYSEEMEDAYETFLETELGNKTQLYQEFGYASTMLHVDDLYLVLHMPIVELAMRKGKHIDATVKDRMHNELSRLIDRVRHGTTREVEYWLKDDDTVPPILEVGLLVFLEAKAVLFINRFFLSGWVCWGGNNIRPTNSMYSDKNHH